MEKKIVVQKYFNDLRKKIRDETAKNIEKIVEQIKQKEKNELAKLDEFERSMNENLERRAQTRPELKRLIDDLNSKRDEFKRNVMPFNYDLKYVDEAETTLKMKRMREELEEYEIKIETIMKKREKLELRILKKENTTNTTFQNLFELVHKK
jgi:hypothetical protein